MTREYYQIVLELLVESLVQKTHLATFLAFLPQPYSHATKEILQGQMSKIKETEVKVDIP